MTPAYHRPRYAADAERPTVSEAHEEGAHDDLRPIRAMLALLAEADRETFARALHQHVHAPASAAERRVRELGFLAQLLDEQPQPPERLPFVERKHYDQRRKTEAPDAPTSAWLVERFGSWKRVCWAAWSLLPDGRKPMGGTPHPRSPPRRPRPAEYTVAEAINSVLACAAALGRTPSSRDYHRWSLSQKRRARETGHESRIARMSIVLRLLAPKNPPPRTKWKLARDRALDGDAL